MSSRWSVSVSLLFVAVLVPSVASASSPSCTPLLAGQTIPAGTVCTWVDGGDFVVSYSTEGGWGLVETHVWVGASLATMPKTKTGSPKLGHFPYGESGLGGATTWSVHVPLASVLADPDACDTSLYVVSHAVVAKGNGKGLKVETAYGAGQSIVKKGSWATYSQAPVPCEPPPPPPEPTCIGFAEAMERGFVTVEVVAGLANLLITNSGDVDVCLDGWYLLTSPTSQDAGVGLRDADGDTTAVIAAGESVLLQRPDWGSSSGPIWWCLEKPQTIWLGDLYATNGAHMPPSLYAIYDAGAGTQISDVIQVGIWDAQSQEPWAAFGGGPALTVGRTRNYFAVPAGTSIEVTVEVMNLADVAGSGVVTETTPAGAVATSFTVPPESSVVNADGSTTWTFVVDVAARAHGGDAAVAGMTLIGYHLAIGSTLGLGRHESAPPTVTYETNDGTSFEASGSPLVLDIQAATPSAVVTL